MSRYKYYIILLIIICLLSFISCKDNNVSYEDGTNDSNISYEVRTLSSYRGGTSAPSDWHAKELVKTKEDLDQLSSEFNISDYISNYDDAYFINNAIVVILFTYSHLSAPLSIESVQKNEDAINIKIVEKQPKNAQYADAIDYWICIIEFDLQDVKEVNNINFETKVER